MRFANKKPVKMTWLYEEDLAELRRMRKVNNKARSESDAEVIRRVIRELGLNEPKESEFDIKLERNRRGYRG